MSLSPSKGSGRKSEAPDRMTSTAKYKDALLLRIITRDAGLQACKSPMKPRGLQQEPSSITAGRARAASSIRMRSEPDRTSAAKPAFASFSVQLRNRGGLSDMRRIGVAKRVVIADQTSLRSEIAAKVWWVQFFSSAKASVAPQAESPSARSSMASAK
jgi:hypothetical protein